MKIAFHTLGCKVNAYETEAMEILEKLFMQHEVVVCGKRCKYVRAYSRFPVHESPVLDFSNPQYDNTPDLVTGVPHRVVQALLPRISAT